MAKERTLGTVVRALREERGWSSADLAREAALDRSAVSRIESDARLPGFEVLCKVADALGFSLDDLAVDLGLRTGRPKTAAARRSSAAAVTTLKRHLEAARRAADNV